MNPQEEVPRRSNFWFSQKSQDRFSWRLFDQITIIFAIAIATFAFVVFWPVISQINFEEAFFTPLAPALMGLVALLGISANDSIRVLFIASLVISTVGIYLLVRDLTRRQVTPILAAVIYLVPPVPIFVLTFLRSGLFETELASARSFFTVIYGDGAHFLGLALIPFAALFFLRYLKRAKKIDLAATTLTCALILLANRSQAINLVLILAVLATTEFFLGQARVKIPRFLQVLVFSLGAVSFWYTLAFWSETLAVFSQDVIGNLALLFPLPFILISLAMLFSFVFFARREDRQPIFASFLLFAVFLGITFDWLVTGRSFMPHPQRLLPSLVMFGAVVGALAIGAVIDNWRLAARLKFDSWTMPIKVLGALAFGLASFLILTAGAFFLSPLLIFVVSGPGGIWTVVRQPVLEDRAQILAVAGENFRLVKVETGGWQTVLGIGLTLITLAILFYLLVREKFIEKDN